MTTRHLITKEDAQRWADLIVGLPLPVTVTWKEGKIRGLSQNALFHAWMGQIAKATSDTIDSVKADCHIRWGIPILRGEDAAYADFIQRALGGRTRAEVKKVIEDGFLPCTRIMSKPQLSRYMDAVWREYAPHVQLWDPAELTWRVQTNDP